MQAELTESAKTGFTCEERRGTKARTQAGLSNWKEPVTMMGKAGRRLGEYPVLSLGHIKLNCHLDPRVGFEGSSPMGRRLRAENWA